MRKQPKTSDARIPSAWRANTLSLLAPHEGSRRPQPPRARRAGAETALKKPAQKQVWDLSPGAVLMSWPLTSAWLVGLRCSVVAVLGSTTECSGGWRGWVRVSLAPLCVLQDEVKLPSKLSISKSLKEGEKQEKEGEGEEVPAGEDHAEEDHIQLSSDEEVEIEEIIEESRAERIKRSGMKRVDDFKKAFSKEKMEKTKLKTKENLEKTRHNLEKTRHNLEKRMNKLGTKIVTNERREKMKTSRDKLRKSFTPDHTIYARSKTAVYKVPPFTFHVKKIREGEVEVKATELVEVGGEEGENSDLMRGESPEMHTLLEITEESDAVLVDKSDSE
uniref:Caveolae associated protein 1 n=1 Tax=Anas platyrhynchos platyrhynchos TaxID=8840 RepID=U3IIR2_ANAPP